jgi:hypothetical protein
LTRWLSLDAVPRALANPGSSSREPRLFYRVPARHPPDALTPNNLPWSFSPLRDMSVWSPLTSELPKARLTFRPQRFSHSRRLAPPHTVAGLFHPTAAFGIAPQGFSPLPSRLASSTSRPLMSLPSFSSQRVAPLVQFHPVRLQGFNPSSGPLRPAGGLDLPSARYPRVFSLLRALFRMPW